MFAPTDPHLRASDRAMKVTCPACSAQYTIAAERLDGRRVKVRCKRCGESFPVDASQQSEEVYARQTETSATSHATQLTGERNESSVLFSLATLARQAPAPPAPKVTESSALIDIRALMSATSKADASAPRADDVVNLGGGGAFAPLFGSPLAPPVTFVPAENEEAARRRKGPIAIGALAVVAIVGVAAMVGVRSTSGARTATAVTVATAISAPANVPSVAGAAPSNTLAMAPIEAPAASGTQLAAVTQVRTSTTSNAAPPARSAAHSNDSRSVTAQAPTASTVSTPSTPSAAAKCCPGESQIACHMRLSTGAACGAEPPGSTMTSAPPFDRPAAARALGINVASCKRGDGPAGVGHVKVTFQPSGSVSAVDVDAPYAGTATGACVAQRYRGVSVPAFAGGPLSAGKSFVIE